MFTFFVAKTRMISLDQVSTAAAGYLTEKWGKPVEVTQNEKIFGGASRETYKLTLSVEGDERGVILRRDPPSSLIDTERELEYAAYERIYPTDIPVPEPLFLEEDPRYLEQPFSIMATIEGSQSDVATLSDDQRQLIGNDKWKLLGRLAKKDPIELGFGAFMDIPAPDECAGRELDYWQGVIEKDEIHPQPIAWAALRWLRRNMPPAAQKLSVVHGDYKSGNFLFDNAGITGVLDWEMCHLGDPLEDLAWSLDPLWSFDTPGLAGRLLPRDEAVRIWEEASGLQVDEPAFRWWRIFVSVKALAIWISSSEDFEKGESKDAILAMAGWVMTDRQNRILLDYLRPEGGTR